MAGGREPNATAMALVQAGTSALTVRWGVQKPPKRGTAQTWVLLCYGTSQRPRRAGPMLAQRQKEATAGGGPVLGEEESLEPQMVLPGSA